jgi:hypothetical protein
MDSLAKEDNIRDLRESLRELPQDIKGTYDEALRRIQLQDRRKVARAEEVLTWINCAKRPLKIDELLCALAIRPCDADLDQEAVPNADSVLSACCGLVVVDPESQIVRLVHYTTEEYFKDIQIFRSPESHRHVAGVLITYLGFSCFASFNPLPDFCKSHTESTAHNDSENAKHDTRKLLGDGDKDYQVGDQEEDEENAVKGLRRTDPTGIIS